MRLSNKPLLAVAALLLSVSAAPAQWIGPPGGATGLPQYNNNGAPPYKIPARLSISC